MHAPLSFRRPPRLPALARVAGRRLRARVPRLRWRRALAGLALLALLGGVAAVALLEQSGGHPQTAFARAPGGQYAVVARNTGVATMVTVVGTTPNETAMEIAVVPHLFGFNLRGTVSPSGRHVALIAPDGGLPTRPLASLLSLNLETGELRRIAEGLDPLQDALWARDSESVLVTRNAQGGGISVVRVALDGKETVLETHPGAVAVAPLGFDAEGRLLAVRIDGRGSTLTREGSPIRWLSAHITRDWSLSPDGTQVAFVEANLAQGLRYLPRVVPIEGGGGVSAATTNAGQALGSAWAPTGDTARFGREPNTSPGSVSAQGYAGFDVPLGYSRDGRSLAVRHWSGTSFSTPGTPQLEIVSGSGRQSLAGYTRFFGWSAR